MTDSLGSGSPIGGSWLRAVIDTAVDAVIIIDHEGLVRLINPACEKQFGFSEQEILGCNVSMLMPVAYADEHDAYLRRYLKTGEKRIIGIGREVRGMRKDGSEFPMELSVGEIPNGDAPHFVGILRDITSRKEAEETLRHAQKMEVVGQLSGGIAHDFNNLLTVILGNLEILEGRLEGERHLKPVRQAREAAELGSLLTNRLLAFARRQTLAPRVVNLNDLVLGLTDLLHRTLGEGVRVSTVLASDLGRTQVDPGQVENALLNLAINARDAMPDGGTLTIETGNVALHESDVANQVDLGAGNYVLLSVSDTGTGMPEDVQERVFEPFFTTKQTGSGTGLGLSMVYGFAKQSGGHVRLQSQVGSGTSVCLYLPRLEASDETYDEAEGKPESQRRPEETVLVVEDDVRVRDITVTRLQDLGYTVLQAEDGPAALEVLATDVSIDLLLTDVVMPGGLTGHELAAKARGLRAGIKVLLTTGYAAGLPEGPEAEILLRKPYTAEELARTVGQALRSS